MALIGDNLSGSGGSGVLALTGSLYLTRGDDDAAGEIRFVEGGGGAHYTGFKAAAAITNSRTYTLPSAFPDSDKVLQSTDAGVLTWETSGGGGGSSPTDAQYITLAPNGDLSAERVLTAGTGITLTDAGAGSTVTVKAGSRYYLTYRHWPWLAKMTSDVQLYTPTGPTSEHSSTYRTFSSLGWSQNADEGYNPGDSIKGATALSTVNSFAGFSVPCDVKLVSSSFGAHCYNAATAGTNMRCGWIRWPCQDSANKMWSDAETTATLGDGTEAEGGGIGSATGSYTGFGVTGSIMWFHVVEAGNTTDGDLNDHIFNVHAEVTGSSYHLTASAGDMVSFFVTAGSSSVGDAGYTYFAGATAIFEPWDIDNDEPKYVL